jgi:hypothetical protein
LIQIPGAQTSEPWLPGTGIGWPITLDIDGSACSACDPLALWIISQQRGIEVLAEVLVQSIRITLDVIFVIGRLLKADPVDRDKTDVLLHDDLLIVSAIFCHCCWHLA